MDSLELSKIAGAVLAALLLIVGSKVIIDTRLAGHGDEVAGYKLPAADAGAGNTEKAEAPPAAPAAGQAPVKPDAPKAEAPAAAGTPPAAPAPAAAGGFDPKSVVALLGTAKADEGKAAFKACAACHSYEKGAASKLGPNLWGIVNRPKAAQADFKGYSEALKKFGGEWSFENLASFIHKPQGYIAGTKMIYKGQKEPADIANLVAYLNTLSDSPAALPK